MNIEELKTIINSDLSDDIKKSEIYNSLAKDENVLLTIIHILNSERELKQELSRDMNYLLSKAHTIIDDPELIETNISEEIIQFYTKYKNIVGHCFKKLF